MIRRPLVVFGLCALMLSVALVTALAHLAKSRSAPQATIWADNAEEQEEKEKFPPALARRLERLKSIPGAGGESPDGRASAEAEKFFALAFPNDDIPLASLEAARSAAARLKGKPFPGGKGRSGTWISVGPSQALYPATPLRNSFGYVPASYVAGGRTTALAIDPNCAPGHCRLWIFAAGGGVWRTKNALSGQPNWEFLSPDFGIQSGSSITLDPNDPTGNTLYVGTGEANASGRSTSTTRSARCSATASAGRP